MKVINAVWEKRNLGVECNEISIDPNDTTSFIKKELPLNESEYTVVKVPSGKFDIMFLLKELGYTYIESSINLIHDLKEIKLNPLQQRVMDSISYSKMNNDDINELFNEIRKGIFTTDRIYIDPYFNSDQAANRYINWISDEIKKGCDIFKLTYKNNSIGFFTFKEIGNNNCYPFLAGMYKDYLKSGLGISIIEKPLKEAINRNYKKMSTYVSINNIKILNVHLSLGFRVNNVYNVFINHQSKEV